MVQLDLIRETSAFLGLESDPAIFNTSTPFVEPFFSEPSHADHSASKELARAFAVNALPHSEGLLRGTNREIHEVLGCGKRQLVRYKSGETLMPLHVAGRWVIEVGMPVAALTNPMILHGRNDLVQQTMKAYTLLGEFCNGEFDELISLCASMFRIPENFRPLSALSDDFCQLKRDHARFESDYNETIGKRMTDFRNSLPAGVDNKAKIANGLGVSKATLESWEAGNGGKKLDLSFLVIWRQLTKQSAAALTAGSIYGKLRRMQEDRLNSLIHLLAPLSADERQDAINCLKPWAVRAAKTRPECGAKSGAISAA